MPEPRPEQDQAGDRCHEARLHVAPPPSGDAAPQARARSRPEPVVILAAST